MILNPQIQQEYWALMDKVQAYLICASVDRAVDCRKLQAELVELYKLRSQNDEVEVAARVARLDQLIDDRIGNLNESARADIVRFLRDRYENTWIYPKIQEISDRLSTILQASERIEDLVESKHPIVSQGKPKAVETYSYKRIFVEEPGEKEKPEEVPEPKVPEEKVIEEKLPEKKPPEKAKQPSRGRGRKKANTPNGKANRVWRVMETIPINEEVSGRQVAERMGIAALSEVKSVSDSLRHLFNKGKLKRRLIDNQYLYWREK